MAQTGGKWKKAANKRKHNNKRLKKLEELAVSARLKELLHEQRRGN